MVNVQIEGVSFTTMSQQEVEAMLINSVKCEMIFTKPNAEKVVLEVMGDLQPNSISFCDDEIGVF